MLKIEHIANGYIAHYYGLTTHFPSLRELLAWVQETFETEEAARGQRSELLARPPWAAT